MKCWYVSASRGSGMYKISVQDFQYTTKIAVSLEEILSALFHVIE